MGEIRKVGSITPAWRLEPFVWAHFRMLSSLDKNVVVMQRGPLGDYAEQHGYPEEPDRTREILEKHFPHVEIYDAEHEPFERHDCRTYNQCLPYVQDMDIVFRLDPDMIFTPDDWDNIVRFVRETEHDAYHMDFARDSINYYYDFDHGLRDAQEEDVLAFDPSRKLENTVNYPSEDPVTFDLGFTCHHFRGWNKKSVGQYFVEEHEEFAEKHGGWIQCPDNIKKDVLNHTA